MLFKPSTIRTYTGRLIDPLHPDPAQIDIIDIAHSLSLQCRFGGHTRVHYSVGEHTNRGLYMLKDQPAEVKLIWLLHDAPETYMTDFTRPLKESFWFLYYRIAEKRLGTCINKKYGLKGYMPKLIQQVDDRMLDWEKKQIFTRGSNPRFKPMSPEFVESEFLEHFFKLRDQLTGVDPSIHTSSWKSKHTN